MWGLPVGAATHTAAERAVPVLRTVTLTVTLPPRAHRGTGGVPPAHDTRNSLNRKLAPGVRPQAKGKSAVLVGPAAQRHEIKSRGAVAILLPPPPPQRYCTSAVTEEVPGELRYHVHG